MNFRVARGVLKWLEDITGTKGRTAEETLIGLFNWQFSNNLHKFQALWPKGSKGKKFTINFPDLKKMYQSGLMKNKNNIAMIQAIAQAAGKPWADRPGGEPPPGGKPPGDGGDGGDVEDVIGNIFFGPAGQQSLAPIPMPDPNFNQPYQPMQGFGGFMGWNPIDYAQGFTGPNLATGQTFGNPRFTGPPPLPDVQTPQFNIPDWLEQIGGNWLYGTPPGGGGQNGGGEREPPEV